MKKQLIIFTVIALVFLSLAGCQSKDSVGAKVIDIPLTQEEYAFGVDKSQPELLDQVNAFIAQIQSDG
ncbi:MAG: transporter substrate-binding domain-containing protein, partial [Clostridiaceae bacterium]|nr:transporter substrate-binding domain-containing protein [Clostridiaceae bacterium]